MRPLKIDPHNLALFVAAADFSSILISLSLVDAAFGGLGINTEGMSFQLFIFIAPVLVCSFVMGFYRNCYEFPSNFIKKIALSLLSTLIFMSGMTWLFPELHASLTTVVLSAVVSCTMVVAMRLVFVRAAGRESLRRDVVVIGRGEDVQRLRRLPSLARTTRFSFIGMDAEGSEHDPVARLTELGARSLSEIVLPDACRPGPALAAALLRRRLEGTHVTLLSAFLERETCKIELSDAEACRLVLTCSARRTLASRVLKRAIDILGSLALLILTLPLTVLVALAIKLDDGGPIFYRQARLGLGGQPFLLTKFRTMRVDADRAGARWATDHDNRITRVGRYLRRPRIDEIPQLFDILRGRMSLVGPRPEQVAICASLEAEIPLYDYRYLVLPGLTGWAQINYPYAGTLEETREKTRYDLYYLKNGSLILDLVILARTVRTVLFGEGSR